MIEVSWFLHQKQSGFVSFFISIINISYFSKLIGIAEARPNAVLGCGDLLIIRIESGGMGLWLRMEKVKKHITLRPSWATFAFRECKGEGNAEDIHKYRSPDISGEP
jgi:hypothetical protein